MEFWEVVRRRRMVRAFDPRPVESATLDRVLDAARRAPSAGNAQGWAFVVLEGPDTARFWDVTLPTERRAAFRWQGLLQAPVVVLPLADRSAYLNRYSEPDKAAAGLTTASAWPVPYWQVDTAFATMLLLLAAEEEGLGALFFGVFRNADSLLRSLGVPEGMELLGAVALGHAAVDEPGRSAGRPRKPLDAIVHRGGWRTLDEVAVVPEAAPNGPAPTPPSEPLPADAPAVPDEPSAAPLPPPSTGAPLPGPGIPGSPPASPTGEESLVPPE